jgi:hydroxymethylbilane synthase
VTRALRLATRGSRQATAKSEFVAELIAGSTGCPVELVLIETTGDIRSDVPLHVIGGQGVFVKEVQRAVLNGRADLAVHSAKDLPSAITPGLVISAFCERRDPTDVLIGSTLDGLSAGATVATGSVRRRAQMSIVRPDIQFRELRGNIDTRLTKIPHGGAIVMAAAALQILGMEDRVDEVLPIGSFVPAVGQGCVAVECRHDDAESIEALSVVDHLPTRHDVEVERAFLAELGSGCSLPVGAHAADGVLRTFLSNVTSGESSSKVLELTGGSADHDLARRAASSSRASLE